MTFDKKEANKLTRRLKFIKGKMDTSIGKDREEWKRNFNSVINEYNMLNPTYKLLNL